MLTFTTIDGYTETVPFLETFIDHHFDAWTVVDFEWCALAQTSPITLAAPEIPGGLPVPQPAGDHRLAATLTARDGHEAPILLTRVEIDDLSYGAREANRIHSGVMADPFHPEANGLRSRLHALAYHFHLTEKPFVGAEPSATHPSGWNLDAREAMHISRGARPAVDVAPGQGRPRFTFALADGRTVEAVSLGDFVDQHFARGDEIDAEWAGRERFADGAILSVAAAGRPDTSVSVVRIDGDGFTIGGSEPAHKGLTRLTDPLGINSPLDNPQTAAFLDQYYVAEGHSLPGTLFEHVGTPEVWVAAPGVTPTVRPTATPEVPTPQPLPTRKPAVTDDGAPTARRGTAAQRLDALTQRHTDPLERLTAATPPPVPHVGRQL